MMTDSRIETPSEPLWVEVLKKTKVKDIIDPNRKLVYAQYNEYVSDLLKKLSAANVLSAVVIEPNGNVWGFVDVLDLLMLAVDCVSFESLSITNLKWEGQCFSRQLAGMVSNFSQSNPFISVTYDTSLWECVRYFGEEIHRLAVVDKDTSRVVNVISQSDIVQFIAERCPYIGSRMYNPIGKEAGITPVGVATVPEGMTVRETLRYMNDTKVSGVAVVDSRGCIVANFSATDLLGLTEDNFSLVTLPVKEYLYKMYGYPKPPVVCRAEDQVEVLFYKFVVQKVHRIYIVDQKMVPVGVVTMTDVMRFLLSGEKLIGA